MPAEKVYVFDACAVIALLDDEPGSEVAESLLENASFGFALDDSMLPALWQEAGRLKAEWYRVSLADCFALAVTIRRSSVGSGWLMPTSLPRRSSSAAASH